MYSLCEKKWQIDCTKKKIGQKCDVENKIGKRYVNFSNWCRSYYQITKCSAMVVDCIVHHIIIIIIIIIII